MPDDPADPVVPAASFSCCWRAMGEAFTRHSLRPLDFEGGPDAQPGRNRGQQYDQNDCSNRKEGRVLVDALLVCHAPKMINP